MKNIIIAVAALLALPTQSFAQDSGNTITVAVLDTGISEVGALKGRVDGNYDLYDPEGWADDALCRAETRQRYRELVFLGLTDALRVFNPQSHLYTFWDYQGGAWQKDNGLRIDHLLLSPQAADRLSASGVDRGPRNKEKPSDHTPVWCELEDGG